MALSRTKLNENLVEQIFGGGFADNFAASDLLTRLMRR